jgi:uncharacterized protein (TIGR02391 family)
VASLVELFPDAETMLGFEPEEIGGALLEILDGSEDNFSQHRFTEPIFRTPGTPGWPQAQSLRVRYAIAEAFAWLERAGLIMPDFNQPAAGHVRLLTTRGRELRTREHVRSYRDAALLPVGLVHPEILPKAQPAFLRGDYEVAVFAAFRAVEVAVRKAAGLPDDALGVSMMRDAFKPGHGPLAEKGAVLSEQEATAHLFAGAIGAAKNPASHREVEMNRTEAVRLILFASYLMSLIDARSAPKAHAKDDAPE